MEGYPVIETTLEYELDNISMLIQKNAHAIASLCSWKLPEFSNAFLESFFASWNNLVLDGYMQDNGKYRYRRYNVFILNNHTQTLTLEENKPHYQAKDYNSLNGGILRYYQSFEQTTLDHPTFISIIKYCIVIFNKLVSVSGWRIEAHQFRIFAEENMPGLPTPEGIHRDGVDYVFMMLIKKENILGGETNLYDLNKNIVKNHTLKHSLETIFLDDTQHMHSVSAVYPFDPNQPAYRDMLVITFRKQDTF